MVEQTGFGVLILAGGASRRMGADKAVLEWNGRRAIDRLADVAADVLGLAPLIVAGRDYGLPFVADPFPGAGPAAGLIAGVDALRAAGCRRALVLAVDAPTILPRDLRPLLDFTEPGAVYAGMPLPMVIAFAAIPPDLAGDAPLKRLAELAGLAQLPCQDEAQYRLRGANTPAERQALISAAKSIRP